MSKTFTFKTIDRTTGREIKRTLEGNRQARARAHAAAERATLDEWKTELRRLGLPLRTR